MFSTLATPSTPHRVKLLAAATRALTPLALLAAVLALVVPSPAIADRSDLLLAALVLATALGISASDLLQLRRHARAVTLLSVVPLIVLALAAWALGQLFGEARATGCSPSACRARRWRRSAWRRWPARTRRSRSGRSPDRSSCLPCSGRWRSAGWPVTPAMAAAATCWCASPSW